MTLAVKLLCSDIGPGAALPLTGTVRTQFTIKGNPPGLPSRQAASSFAQSTRSAPVRVHRVIRSRSVASSPNDSFTSQCGGPCACPVLLAMHAAGVSIQMTYLSHSGSSPALDGFLHSTLEVEARISSKIRYLLHCLSIIRMIV